MKTKIDNDREFDDTIDQYGQALDEIARKKAEADVLKQLLEAYANEKKVTEHATKLYALAMTCDAPSLRRMKGMREADVIALLKRSETGKGYVISAYDSTALKGDFRNTAAGRKQLAAFGLFYAESKPHAEVTRLSERDGAEK